MLAWAVNQNKYLSDPLSEQQSPLATPKICPSHPRSNWKKASLVLLSQLSFVNLELACLKASLCAGARVIIGYLWKASSRWQDNVMACVADDINWLAGCRQMGQAIVWLDYDLLRYFLVSVSIIGIYTRAPRLRSHATWSLLSVYIRGSSSCAVFIINITRGLVIESAAWCDLYGAVLAATRLGTHTRKEEDCRRRTVRLCRRLEMTAVTFSCRPTKISELKRRRFE